MNRPSEMFVLLVGAVINRPRAINDRPYIKVITQ